MDWIVSPSPNSYVDILTPAPKDVTWFEYRVLIEVTE